MCPQALLANGMPRIVNVIYTDFVEGARGVDLALNAMFPPVLATGTPAAQPSKIAG